MSSWNVSTVTDGGLLDASDAATFAFGQGKRNRITVDGGMIVATNLTSGVEWRLGDDYSNGNIFEVKGGGLVSVSNAMFSVGLGQNTMSNVLRIVDGSVVRISGDKFAKDRDNKDIVSLRIGTQGGDFNRVEIVGGTLDMNGLGIDCGYMWGWGSTGNELYVGTGGVVTNVGALKVGEHEPGNRLVVSNGTIQATTLAFAGGTRATEIATYCKVSGGTSRIETASLLINNRHDLIFEIPARGYAEAPFQTDSLQYGTAYGKPAVTVVADEKFLDRGGEVPLIVSESALPAGLASDIDWNLPPNGRLIIKEKTVSVRFPQTGFMVIVR